MMADGVQKPKWFQGSTDPRKRYDGKGSVRIEHESAINHSMGSENNHKSNHTPHTGDSFTGENSISAENGVDIDHTQNPTYTRDGDFTGERIKHYEQCEKQSKRERGSSSSHVNLNRKNTAKETPGFGCLTMDSDFLDTTFDGIESYACKEPTRGKFPFALRPPSPKAPPKAPDKRSDCLDTTFEGIEKYACREPTSGKFPFASGPPSPTVPYRQRQSLDDGFEIRDMNISEKGEKNAQGPNNMRLIRDGYDFEIVSDSSNNQMNSTMPTGLCSTTGSNGALGFIIENIGRLFQYRGNEQLNETPNSPVSDHLKSNIATTANTSLSTTANTTNAEKALIESSESNLLSDQAKTLNTEQKQLESYASLIPMNRENSLVDTGNDDKDKQDRLNLLRQSKRAIERERLRQSQSQTIVIPRNSLYMEEENVEDSKPRRSTRNLKVGSTVTSKQAKKFYFCRKLVFIATVLLISVGVVILAMALFWPTRMI